MHRRAVSGTQASTGTSASAVCSSSGVRTRTDAAKRSFMSATPTAEDERHQHRQSQPHQRATRQRLERHRCGLHDGDVGDARAVEGIGDARFFFLALIEHSSLSSAAFIARSNSDCSKSAAIEHLRLGAVSGQRRLQRLAACALIAECSVRTRAISFSSHRMVGFSSVVSCFSCELRAFSSAARVCSICSLSSTTRRYCGVYFCSSSVRLSSSAAIFDCISCVNPLASPVVIEATWRAGVRARSSCRDVSRALASATAALAWRT